MVCGDVIRDHMVRVSVWTYEYGTKLKYAAIAVSTDLERSNLGFKKGLPIRDAWEEFMTNEVNLNVVSVAS